MTIGKVTTANFTPPSFSTERDRFRKEMNEKLEEILHIAENNSQMIAEITVQVDAMSKSLEEDLRSSELMERQMSESRNVKLFSGNDSENVKPSGKHLQTSDALQETFSSKFLSFFRNIWNFFTFKSEE